jgi:integrase
MAVSSITIRAVQALKPGETIWDADHREAVRGFGVRRQRDQATYVLKYRVFGRQRFVTIGPHGAPWTPELARKEAKRLLGLVANGKDPADEKAKARLQAADTLLAIADQYLRNAKQRLKPRTYSEIERYLLVSWKPLHPVSVFQITRRHISARIADIASAHGTVSAARARTALSSMFNWAIREGLDIAANPVLGTNRPTQPASRERVLTETELSAIWHACGDDDYGRIVRLLLLTAQRRDEVGSMQWAELDTFSGLWTLPSARTKNHREHSLPLMPAALTLLPHRRNGRDFLFGDGPRRSGDKPQKWDVFSLEVSKNCSVFKGRSDIFGVFGTLRSLQNFSLSEWREVPGVAPKLLIADSLPALGASSAPAQCRRINLQPTYLDWQKWASVCRLHPTARKRTSCRT